MECLIPSSTRVATCLRLSSLYYCNTPTFTPYFSRCQRYSSCSSSRYSTISKITHSANVNVDTGRNYLGFNNCKTKGFLNVNVIKRLYSSSREVDVDKAKTDKKIMSKSTPTLGSNPAGIIKRSEEKQGPVSSFMNLPTNVKKIKEAVFGDEGDWITIYKFNQIRTARVIQKFKIYQTTFSCFIALPIAFFSTARGIISPDMFTFVGVGCGLACSMLYFMGNMVSNLIGVMYVTDKDPEIVRIGYMNFWGTREDELFKKTDFVPFSDLPDRVDDAYVYIRLYSDPEHLLKMSIKYGQVIDEERFFEIFGRVAELKGTSMGVGEEEKKQ